MQQTGATWIATSDYRTYAMLRWYFNGRVPVIQINERGRFQGFRDPGMDLIRDQPGLYVAREPDNRLPLWDLTTAKRQPLERVERVWRGTVMDTYALEKLTGWTPELSPPPDSPLFRWRVLAKLIKIQQPEGGASSTPRSIGSIATAPKYGSRHLRHRSICGVRVAPDGCAIRATRLARQQWR